MKRLPKVDTEMALHVLACVMRSLRQLVARVAGISLLDLREDACRSREPVAADTSHTTPAPSLEFDGAGKEVRQQDFWHMPDRAPDPTMVTDLLSPAA
jgi:hypothetical protein